MAYNDTPINWLWSFGDRPQLVLDGNITWPFPNVPSTAIVSVHQLFTIPIREIIMAYGTIISSIGIVLSLLSICAMWRKTFKERNSFFSVMMIIALLDFFFNLGSLLMRTVRDTYTIEGSHSYFLMWLMNILRGITYSISLCSDLCVMALTIERYIAVSNPHIYHNLTPDKMTVIRVSTALVITLLGFTRVHYSYGTTVIKVGDIYVYAVSPIEATMIEQVLATFSDMIFPFILLLVMIIVSSKLVIIIVKRSRTRTQVKALTPAGQTKSVSNNDDNTSSMVILTFILDILFIFNQLGYCTYAIIEVMSGQCVLSFDCTTEELMYWCTITWASYIAALLSVITECLSHAINFLLYFLFSHGFRVEFRWFGSSVLSKFKSSQSGSTY